MQRCAKGAVRREKKSSDDMHAGMNARVLSDSRTQLSSARIRTRLGEGRGEGEGRPKEGGGSVKGRGRVDRREGEGLSKGRGGSVGGGGRGRVGSRATNVHWR